MFHQDAIGLKKKIAWYFFLLWISTPSLFFVCCRIQTKFHHLTAEKVAILHYPDQVNLWSGSVGRFPLLVLLIIFLRFFVSISGLISCSTSRTTEPMSCEAVPKCFLALFPFAFSKRWISVACGCGSRLLSIVSLITSPSSVVKVQRQSLLSQRHFNLLLNCIWMKWDA